MKLLPLIRLSCFLVSVYPLEVTFVSKCPCIIIQDQSTPKKQEMKEKDIMKCLSVTEKEKEELDEG